MATANVGLMCGASIDFVDIDPTTLNYAPKLKEKLESSEKQNKLPKVVGVVHFAGEPAIWPVFTSYLPSTAKLLKMQVVVDRKYWTNGWIF